jgi:hypothetical protein
MVVRALCRRVLSFAVLAFSVAAASNVASIGHAADAPTPFLEKGRSVDWWFVFKFNTKAFPNCAAGAKRKCPFGGDVQDYPKGFGQQYVYSTKGAALKKGRLCLGDTTGDPVGATFDKVYNGSYFYVLWNDQFYNDPDIAGCNGRTYCEAPWAHSKGMLAWNDEGEGFVMQVTTPNWPGSGSKKFPRQQNGNTLGCITKDGESPHNNVWVSQHFFAVKLNKDDVLKVLTAFQNAGVVTEHDDNADHREQVVNNGGPPEVRQKVDELGVKSHSDAFTKDTLSSGVQLISKPPRLTVPPWQMVSAVLGGVSLKVATWYSVSKIPDTDGATTPGCWNASLGQPGAVTNVETGRWGSTSFGLFGGVSPDRNHAKIGVSTTGNLAIFGDMNQEGALSGAKCAIKQNGRGGLFFVVDDEPTARSLRTLMSGVE